MKVDPKATNVDLKEIKKLKKEKKESERS